MTEKTSDQTASGIIAIRGKAIGYVRTSLEVQDVQIQTNRLHTALNGDAVEIKILSERLFDRVQGEVVRIIERARTKFVGVLESGAKGLILRPDSKRMYAPIVIKNPPADAVPGLKALVGLSAWNEPGDPEGEILHVLGPVGVHEVEMQAIVLESGFDLDFPEDVKAEAAQIDRDKAKLMEEAVQEPGRRDLRAATTFTIDPADAKDFDDALSLAATPEGNLEIGVHIAEVSYFVRPGSAIDREAVKRGTSIYLVDRTIPMLPEVLSNDLCSLRPNEDRLAFSALFTMNTQGEILGRWFGRTVIHSDKRFSYEEAQQTLDANAGAHLEELQTLDRIARILRKARYADGSIAFETDEVRFVLDENGKPIKVYKKERLDTMLMIEDWMLLANREVTEEVHRIAKRFNADPGFVYRVHDVPNPEKIEELDIFLRAIGYDLKSNKGIVTAKNMNEVLRAVAGKPEEHLVSTATIRSMAKAIYSTKNIGHFGLAFRYYTHFTSPIRRYPDLMVHRLLQRYLDGKPIQAKEVLQYERLSVQSSEREASAVEAERDSVKYKQVEYMRDHIGETFDGIVSGVAEWGVYVEEVNTKAEGMVNVRAMRDDFYALDKKQYAMVGQRTKKTYRLGDRVRVKLLAANLEQKQIDWEFVTAK